MILLGIKVEKIAVRIPYIEGRQIAGKAGETRARSTQLMSRALGVVDSRVLLLFRSRCAYAREL